MELIGNVIEGGLWIAFVVFIFVVLAIFAVYYKIRYKVAKAGQALVVTGGKKEPKILPGGGAFIPPNRKHDFFPIGVMTVSSPEKETQTSSMVPIVVGWTAQLRVDVDPSSLEKAVRGFDSYDPKDIASSLQQTLDGEVRAVVATMTPEKVVTDKVTFKDQVTEGVAPRMTELGFSLVSLNISEVTDRNDYYRNLAAKDREAQRQEAETLTAQANKQVAIEQAVADRASREAGLDRDLAIEEKNRGVALRKAEIKIETDTAEANAAIAGDLQTEIRNQELATRKGEVRVVEAQQDQAAATAQRQAELTRAETSKQRREIEAAADKRNAEINAEADAAVAKAQAIGEADAAKAKAQGAADALDLTTTAKANELRLTGEAEAAATRARGEAEAASIEAKGKAEAKVQREMAEALAANNGANLRVTLAEIQRDTTVKVYTTVGEAMAHIGENATFIDMGGSSNGGGDLFSKVLGNVPELLKQLDVKSTALNGVPFGESLGDLVASVSGKSSRDDSEPAVEVDVVDANVESDDPQVEQTSGDTESVEDDATVSEDNPGRITSVEFEDGDSLR